MPARQGATIWPQPQGNRVVQVDPYQLPLPDNSARLILLTHILEFQGDPGRFLQELYRILMPEGRLLVLVPNRHGLWIFADSTPFGHGRPYTAGQLKHLLREHRFVPETTGFALFCPPLKRSGIYRMAPLIERFGRRFGGVPAGALLLSARKKTLADIPVTPATEQLELPVDGLVPALPRQCQG